MDYTVSLQVQHQLAVFPTHFYQGYSVELQMKSTEVDQGLFTDSYCKVCSAQLISESQRVAHYESRKHANKVRLYYMLHPVDGGCPAKKLRTDNGSDKGDVDKNKCCTLCNMSFTSAVVAQSHYQGKIHAKRLKLLLGEQPAIMSKEASPSPVKSSPETSPMTSPRQRRDSDRYCQLCNAWFNNPGMAQQHYDGKKHKKNAARADLLEQLGKTLDMGEMKGMERCCWCLCGNCQPMSSAVESMCCREVDAFWALVENLTPRPDITCLTLPINPHAACSRLKHGGLRLRGARPPSHIAPSRPRTYPRASGLPLHGERDPRLAAPHITPRLGYVRGQAGSARNIILLSKMSTAHDRVFGHR
ncbi:zinc finger matrin-type protein 4 [Epinephelus moara]|uniref:zinc finger matrin-type protein 4 n=1 Tax=Epinephelus moara TaxID=300413 RepID=UPI00214ED60C|nr:zinc finger matrin-type protein 4 [Epinephelus moara]